MKVKYGFLTPKETKDFLDPIDWDLLHDTFSEYIGNIAPNVQIKFPEAINIGGIGNVIAKLIYKFSGTMTGGTYTLSSRSIQINTVDRIKEYALLVAIIHELTHALGFNDHKDKSGYSVGKKYNHLNEGVTQKIAEELTDRFLAKTDLGNKQALYIRQVAHNLALTILGSGDLLEQVKQAIPSIGRILESDLNSRKASGEIARELLDHPEIRASIELKAEENLIGIEIYLKEISTVNQLISALSKHSGKPEGEVWNLIKRGYFEGIDIVELCTYPQYGIQYNKKELEELLSDV